MEGGSTWMASPSTCAPLTVTVTGPGSSLTTTISSLEGAPEVSCTPVLSSFTLSSIRMASASVGSRGSDFPEPAESPLDFTLPNGVMLMISGSTYQYHWPSTSFQ